MQYRKIGRDGLDVSILGFGMMRLPHKDGKPDAERSVELLRYAVDHGVNYVDTAYNYLDGDSERITGMALSGGYREKVLLTTKCPVWLLESPEDFDRILDEQLGRLKTDDVDFYLFHGMNSVFWKKVEEMRLTDKMKAAKQSGKVRHIGFSFHDNLDTFKKIVDCGLEWDVCQIQLNYYDENFQAGLQGLQYANQRGISTIIMEPLRGGLLANVPEKVQNIFDGTDKSPCEWAFDYLWNRKEISVTLSGMNSLEQVTDNIAFASKAQAGMLTPADESVIHRAQEAFHSYNVIPCTGCAYCHQPCPQNVAIPYIFSAYNGLQFHGDRKQAIADYQFASAFGNNADACIGCHQCEKICPQHIEIVEWLKKIRSMLGDGQDL